VPRRPRNRGIKRKEKTIGLSEDQLDHLIRGKCWPFKTDETFPFESETARAAAWERHKEQIFRECMTDDETRAGYDPFFIVGSRPQCWWEYENPPEREFVTVRYQPGHPKHEGGLELERTDYEPMERYLDRTGLWRTDEKRRYLAMKERQEKQFQKLSSLVDLDERRELNETVRKVKQEYED
jgi:hypothetical protein